MNDSGLGAAMGRIPSGIFILTVRRGDDETGMLASWVQQAGFEPPMLSVAVRQGRYVGEWLDAKAPFVLNLVGEGDKRLLKHFGRGFEPGAPAFDGVEIERTASGAAILREAVAHLECATAGHVDSGDHRVYLARVLSGALHGDNRPMVHIRKSGLHY